MTRTVQMVSCIVDHFADRWCRRVDRGAVQRGFDGIVEVFVLRERGMRIRSRSELNKRNILANSSLAVLTMSTLCNREVAAARMEAASPKLCTTMQSSFRIAEYTLCTSAW